MGVVLGIDIGGSATKIVGFVSRPEAAGSVTAPGPTDNPPPMAEGCLLHFEPVGELFVKAADQITSMYGAIGHFAQKFGVSLGDVEKIILTGVGATFFDEDIYGISTEKVDEFIAIGYGGLCLSSMDEAFVVSIGTGTAFVRATREEVMHIGGSGVGGGTLLGLSSLLLKKGDVDAILALAENGYAENVDLLVRDIIGHDIPSLPANLTAANFGNVKSTASEADIAVGIINMIIQTVGMLAAFVSKNDSIKTFILTGTLAELPQAKEIFDAIGDIHGIKFMIPRNAVFATAIGAAVSFLKDRG